MQAKSAIALPAVFLLLLLVGLAGPGPDQEPLLLGKGKHTYAWVRDWVQLPEGMTLGNTHGSIAVDSRGYVYVNTDTERAVIVLGPDGKYLDSWGEQLAGGLHGMTLVEEDGEEFLYLVHTGRHELFKTDLKGELLWKRGWPEEAQGIYADAKGFRPTSIAVAPTGDIYVADGYGASWVHQFEQDGTYVRSFGGPGEEDGKFRTCHGIDVDATGEEVEVWVADRENHRLQRFSTSGEWRGTVAGDLRRPCSVVTDGTDRLVADLAGRVTILTGDGELICHLGDNPDPKKRANNGVPVEQWEDGEFLAPHHATWDREGNLYVMDWVSAGRITKLERVPAASNDAEEKHR